MIQCLFFNQLLRLPEGMGRAGVLAVERVLLSLRMDLWRWREMEECVLCRLSRRDLLMTSVGDEEQTVTPDEE